MESLSMSANETSKSSTAETAALPNNVMAALGYFCGLAAVLALLIDPYRKDRNARFHAIQALLFSGSCFVGYMAIAIIAAILSLMARMVLGGLGLYTALGVMIGIPTFLTGVLSLAMFVTWLVLIVRSAMGHKVTLPVIGPMAEKMSSAQASSNA